MFHFFVQKTKHENGVILAGFWVTVGAGLRLERLRALGDSGRKTHGKTFHYEKSAVSWTLQKGGGRPGCGPFRIALEDSLTPSFEKEGDTPN